MKTEKIKRCSCKDINQNVLYGTSKRLFILDDNGDKWVCTSCGRSVKET